MKGACQRKCYITHGARRDDRPDDDDGRALAALLIINIFMVQMVRGSTSFKVNMSRAVWGSVYAYISMDGLFFFFRRCRHARVRISCNAM